MCRTLDWISGCAVAAWSFRGAAAILAWVALASPAGAQCTSDNEKRVAGKGECLAIHTFRPKTASAAPKLAIVIHGDQSDGGPIRSNIQFARDAEFEDTIRVAILRPGYADPDNNASTGNNYQRNDSYTAHNIDAIAEAIKALKSHYKASRTILVGHSGGSAMSAVILGRHPGLVDGALLLSCPCNIQKWRAGKREWPRSESPIRYTGTVPATTRLVAITANDDDVTLPTLAAEYVDALKKRNVVAEFATIPRGGHNGPPSSPEAKAALRKLLGE